MWSNDRAGWPATLAVIYAVTNESFVAARLMNIVFSLVTILSTFHITRQVFSTTHLTLLSQNAESSPLATSTARGTALLLALYPNHIAYTSLLFTELFFTALLTSGIALLFFEKWRLDAVAGVVFALAVLTKPQVLFVPLLVLGWQWLRLAGTSIAMTKVQTVLTRAALIYGVVLLFITPWLYRNYTVFGDFVFVSTNGGFNLYLGNNPEAEGFYHTSSAIWEAIGDEDVTGPAAELQRDRTARRLAIEWITQHPEKMPGLVLRKALGMYRDNTEALGWANNGTSFDLLVLLPWTRVLYAIL